MSKQKAVIFDAMGVVFVEGNDTVYLTYPYMVDRNPDLELQVLIDAYIEAAEGRMTAEELWKTCGFTENIAQLEALAQELCGQEGAVEESQTEEKKTKKKQAYSSKALWVLIP